VGRFWVTIQAPNARLIAGDRILARPRPVGRQIAEAPEGVNALRPGSAQDRIQGGSVPVNV